MEEILEELNQVSGVLGSIIVGKDGLVITSNVHSDIDADFYGAMVAGVYTAAEGSIEKLFQGELDMVMVEGGQKKLFLTNVGAVLVVVTEEHVNMGLLRLEIKNASEKLKKLL